MLAMLLFCYDFGKSSRHQLMTLFRLGPHISICNRSSHFISIRFHRLLGVQCVFDLSFPFLATVYEPNIHKNNYEMLMYGRRWGNGQMRKTHYKGTSRMQAFCQTKRKRKTHRSFFSRSLAFSFCRCPILFSVLFVRLRFLSSPAKIKHRRFLVMVMVQCMHRFSFFRFGFLSS